MRRSSIITRFAIEAGYMDEQKSKVLIREYQNAPESTNLTFESWAITKGHLKIEQAKSLLVTIASSRFMCTSCGNGFLGNELIGGTEYRCPNCNGEDFLLQSKAKAADDKVSKAPKLMTPPEGMKKSSANEQNITTSDSLTRPRNDTTGLGSFLTDSVIESDEERAKREIEEIENESQKALKKAVFSKFPEKKLSDDDKSQKIEFTAEMMDRGLPPGALLDGIKIEKIIGRGGIGIVYKGLDLTLERPVALKVLNSEVLSDKAQVERFGIEARSMAQLEHPNVVQVYKFGEKFGRPYLSMQWIDGENIGQKIDKQGALPLSDCLYWFIQTARGLLEAHNHGIIHRDIKPDNIIVNSKGKVKIVDFGLAKQVVKAEHIGLSDPRFVLGTPAYIAPEQALGEEIDNRTDIYSFAISMFHALTGKLPFTGSPAAVVHQHISTPLPYIREYVASIPEELNRLIKVMSSKNMENRPNDMAEIVSKLEQILFDQDPEYASRVSIAPKYDSIMMNNKKILADSNQILAVFDESEEDGTFTAAQEAQKIREQMRQGNIDLGGEDSNDNILDIDGADFFDEIQNSDIFNTTSDFTTNEIDVFGGKSSKGKSADPRINDEIKKIREEMGKSGDANDSSDGLFDSNFDAFDDLQVEVLESERSEDMSEFEFMKDQLKQKSAEEVDTEDDNDDDIAPLDEVEYTEDSDVVLADEDDILITGKLQARDFRQTKKKPKLELDGDETEEEDESDVDNDLPEKIKLQVSQSFTSRAHQDDSSDKPGVATISQEQAEKLMAQHRKAKSPRSVSVTRIIPIASTFIIVFMLSFTLFLALTSNPNPKVSKRSETALKGEQNKLLNKAQSNIDDYNGTLGKVTLSSMKKFMSDNKDFNFSTDFLTAKYELESMIKKYEIDSRRKDGEELKDLDYSNFSVVGAQKHLEKIQSYIDENPKLANQFNLEKIKTEIKKYIITRKKKEADEVQISEFIKVYNDMNTKSLEELYDVKFQLKELLSILPEYKKDPRLVNISKNIEGFINQTPEKKELDKILTEFESVHKPYSNTDLNELLKRLGTFLDKYKMFRTGDEGVKDALIQAQEFEKEEDRWYNELVDEYDEWIKIKDVDLRISKITKLIDKYIEYMSKVPKINNDPAIKLRYDELSAKQEINEAEEKDIANLISRADKTSTIAQIDEVMKDINSFLSSRKYLSYRLDKTKNMLDTRRKDFVRRNEEKGEADIYREKVNDIVKRLKLNKEVVAEGEKMLQSLKSMIETKFKFKELFTEIVKDLEEALQHEMLVTQANFNGFVWQAEKVKHDDKFQLDDFKVINNIAHNAKVSAIITDKSKKFLLTCDALGNVKVFFHNTLEEIRSFKIFGVINDAIFTEKPELVIFAFANGNVELWNIALRERVSIIHRFDKPINCLAFYNQSFFCGGENTEITQISLENIYKTDVKPEFKIIRTLNKPRGAINALEISPDQKYIAAGCNDNNVYIWTLENPESDNFVLSNHSAAISSLSFSENSMGLLSTSSDGKITIWSLQTRSLSRDFKPSHRRSYKNGIYLNSDKVILFSQRTLNIGDEAVLELVNIEGNVPEIVIDKIFDELSFMKVIIVDGIRYLYCATNDGSIYSYAEIVKDEWSINFKSDFIIETSFITSETDGLKIFNVFKSGKLQLKTIDGTTIYEESLKNMIVNCASISPEKGKVVIGTKQGKLISFDINTKELNIPDRDQFLSSITSVSYNKDASKVIVGLENKSAYLYDTSSRKNTNLIGLNGATIFTAINSIDSIGVYGIASGFFTPITLPGGSKSPDITITCNYATYIGFNNLDDEEKNDLLFIGYRDRSNKSVLMKCETQTWSKKELVSDIEHDIVNVSELSKTLLLVALDNGDILVYKHNMYDYGSGSSTEFELYSKLSFKDLSDRVLEFYVQDDKFYAITIKGSIIALSLKKE